MAAKRDSRETCCGQIRPTGLRIPADAPTAQFWAVDLYSEDTRRHYDNGDPNPKVRSVAINSRMQDIKRNADGSLISTSAPRHRRDMKATI
jgi:hypothetical protein